MIDKLSKVAEGVEQLLLFALCKDYNNFIKIKKYVSQDDFLFLEFGKVYSSISSLYDKSAFKNITPEIVDIHAREKNLGEEEKERLKAFVEMSGDFEVDFDGTYNMFKRNSGMYKLIKESNKYGGFEKMFQSFYEQTETMEDMKSKIDSISRTCFKSYKASNKATCLASGMVQYVEERMFAKSDGTIDLLDMPLIQSYSKGIHVGLTGFLAQSGQGKTTFGIPMFCIPVLESGQKLISIHNEQEEDEIRQLYLMSYITRVKKETKGLHRNNFNAMNGNRISANQKEYLIQCARDFEERYAGRLEFVFVPRFNEDDLEALILDYQREGYQNVFLDTFKTEDSSTGWEGMDNLAKKLDGISKDLKMKIVYTAQLAAHMSWRKYLDVSCVGKAKALKETATSFYMFRHLSQEEIPTITFTYWKWNEEEKRAIWTSKQQLEATRLVNGNPVERHYIAMFNDKQRKGEDGNVIIMECDLGTGYMREIGITRSIKNDNNGTR